MNFNCLHCTTVLLSCSIIIYCISLYHDTKEAMCKSYMCIYTHLYHIHTHTFILIEVDTPKLKAKVLRKVRRLHIKVCHSMNQHMTL